MDTRPTFNQLLQKIPAKPDALFSSEGLKVVAPQIDIFHIYTGPKFTQIPDLHGTQIYTNPDLHGTHIYTAQIYTNPFPHIDSKKPKFTQPNFAHHPLHKTFSSNFAQTI